MSYQQQPPFEDLNQSEIEAAHTKLGAKAGVIAAALNQDQALLALHEKIENAKSQEEKSALRKPFDVAFKQKLQVLLKEHKVELTDADRPKVEKALELDFEIMCEERRQYIEIRNAHIAERAKKDAAAAAAKIGRMITPLGPIAEVARDKMLEGPRLPFIPMEGGPENKR